LAGAIVVVIIATHPDASSNSLRERFFDELALESWFCLKSKVRSVETE